MLELFEQAGKKNCNNVKYQFWQQHNQPIDVSVSYGDRMYRALNYIHENPVRAKFVYSAEQYQYSSAIDYAGEKGLVKIERIWL